MNTDEHREEEWDTDGFFFICVHLCPKTAFSAPVSSDLPVVRRQFLHLCLSVFICVLFSFYFFL